LLVPIEVKIVASSDIKKQRNKKKSVKVSKNHSRVTYSAYVFLLLN